MSNSHRADFWDDRYLISIYEAAGVVYYYHITNGYHSPDYPRVKSGFAFSFQNAETRARKWTRAHRN